MDKIIKLGFIKDKIIDELTTRISNIKDKIKLTCIIAGNDPSSMSYLSGIKKNGEKLGIDVEIVQCGTDISETDFVELLTKTNESSTNGILIQVPLPDQIDRFTVAKFIDFTKDVDGISPYNQGLIYYGKPFMIPATAWACDIALKDLSVQLNIPLKGKKAVVIGRSITVGKPAFHLLLKRDLTPTIVHTKTNDISEITQDADVVVASCGVAKNVKGSWVKNGAIVLDVGINCITLDNGECKICGDADADDVAEAGGYVTAVPGGIGALTSSLVFANCIKGYYKQKFNEEIVFNFEK